jgi:hypothetical protein
MMELGVDKALRNAGGLSAEDLLDLQEQKLHDPGKYSEAQRFTYTSLTRAKSMHKLSIIQE